MAVSTLLLTLAAILVSVAITMLAGYLEDGQVDFFGLGLAVLVPAVVAPLFAFTQLSLLERLHAVQAELRRLAETDDLTQAHNRRYFFEQAEQHRQRAALMGERFAVALLDLDNFKQVNDSLGHPAGDEVLRAVSELCRRQIRPTDVFARYGGEEFIFLLPGVEAEGAAVFAERIRSAIEQAHIQLSGDPAKVVRLSASLGVLLVPRGQIELSHILRLADQALYQAKAAGKNQVVVISQAEAGGA